MKVLMVIGVSLSLVCCAISPSRPVSFTSGLKEGQGAIIFSTVGDAESSGFGTGFVNTANEIVSLGLASETRIFQITFKRKDRQQKSGWDTFTLGHSYKTKGLASTLKWHIMPLEAGSYYISRVAYEDHVSFTRKITLPPELFSFDVVEGEWIYLGSFVTAFKELQAFSVHTSKQYGRSSSYSFEKVSELPIIADVSWDETEARKQAARYPNYPKIFNSAEYSEADIAAYKEYLQKRSAN